MRTYEQTFIRRDGEELYLIVSGNRIVSDFQVKEIELNGESNPFVVVVEESNGRESIVDWFEDVDKAFASLEDFRQGDLCQSLNKDDFSLYFLDKYVDTTEFDPIDPPEEED